MQKLTELLPDPSKYDVLPYEELLKLKTETVNSMPGKLSGYDCKKCLNRGYIARIRDNTEVMVRCSCLNIREALRRIKESGLENRLDKCTFDNFLAENDWQRVIKERSKAFLSDYKGNWFFAGGQSGSGKTHICTAIVRELLYMGNSVRYMLWREDSVRLKQKINEPEYTEEMSVLQNADVLYIDDLFKGSVTAADKQLAFQLLDYRYRNTLTTIISSEMLLTQIITADEAIGGRIAEMSGAYSYGLKKDPEKNYRIKGNFCL